MIDPVERDLEDYLNAQDEAMEREERGALGLPMDAAEDEFWGDEEAA